MTYVINFWTYLADSTASHIAILRKMLRDDSRSDQLAPCKKKSEHVLWKYLVKWPVRPESAPPKS